ncbi:MAG: hypothetical protein Q8P55_02275 [bacterium]|nr:hypothetical protein [bacterium]
MKPFLLFLLSIFLLSVPGNSAALNTIAPANGTQGVEVDAYFQWQEVSGATKYVLDIVKFTQSEDNIPSSVCAGGICSFAFLDLSIGRIEFADSYTWKITAYNPAGNPLDDSAPATFTTEQAPVVQPPPGQLPGNGGEIPGEGGPAINPSIFNPISSATLNELFENVLNFLFGISIVILPIIIIYAGILLLTAGGDPTKISRSRTILLWAIIAFAIILLARGLPTVLRSLL